MKHFSAFLLLPLLLAACAPAAPTGNPGPAAGAEPAAESRAAPQFESAALVTLWNEQDRLHRLVPVDPSDGRPVPGYAPLELGGNYYYAFTPDRTRLAVLSYRADDPRNPVLHNLDLVRWEDRQTTLPFTGWIAGADGLSISADGRYLAAAASHAEGALLVFDLKHNEIVAQIEPEFDVRRVQFSDDGEGLMAYGAQVINRFMSSEQTSGFARAALFDSRDLSLLWSAEVPGLRDGVYPTEAGSTADLHADPTSAIYLYPGVVFAPRGDRLYAVHADEDRLTTIDFAGRSMHTLVVQPALSWFERLLMAGGGRAYAKMANGSSRNAVISPDGDVIYTLGTRNEVVVDARGNWEFTSVPIGLQAIDPSTGRELFKHDTPAVDMKLVPDGTALLLQNWDGPPSTDLLSLDRLQLTVRFKLAIALPTRSLDGSLLLVSALTGESGATRMSAYSRDGTLLGDWQAAGYAEWLMLP
jgi:hypothetical protein